MHKKLLFIKIAIFQIITIFLMIGMQTGCQDVPTTSDTTRTSSGVLFSPGEYVRKSDDLSRSLVFFTNHTYYYHDVSMSYVYAGKYSVESNNVILYLNEDPIIVLSLALDELIVQTSKLEIIGQGSVYILNDLFNENSPPAGYFKQDEIAARIGS